jgi:hypothetical protein
MEVRKALGISTGILAFKLDYPEIHIEKHDCRQ